MARKKSSTLTDAEFKIMNVLWEKQEASVREVADALARVKPLAYNTVLTMLKVLLDKGYVDYVKEGRAFIYRPLCGKHEARMNAVKHLLNRFFNNSPSLLMQNLIADETISSEELSNLRQQITDSQEVL